MHEEKFKQLFIVSLKSKLLVLVFQDNEIRSMGFQDNEVRSISSQELTRPKMKNATLLPPLDLCIYVQLCMDSHCIRMVANATSERDVEKLFL